jgi:hypothetical protein
VSANLRQVQPDVAIPPATWATVARKAERANFPARPSFTFFAASIGTSGSLAFESELIIQLLARQQPKDSANSNAEPGNAGLNLPGARLAGASMTPAGVRAPPRALNTARITERCSVPITAVTLVSMRSGRPAMRIAVRGRQGVVLPGTCGLLGIGNRIRDMFTLDSAAA